MLFLAIDIQAIGLYVLLLLLLFPILVVVLSRIGQHDFLLSKMQKQRPLEEALLSEQAEKAYRIWEQSGFKPAHSAQTHSTNEEIEERIKSNTEKTPRRLLNQGYVRCQTNDKRMWLDKAEVKEVYRGPLKLGYQFYVYSQCQIYRSGRCLLSIRCSDKHEMNIELLADWEINLTPVAAPATGRPPLLQRLRHLNSSLRRRWLVRFRHGQ